MWIINAHGSKAAVLGAVTAQTWDAVVAAADVAIVKAQGRVDDHPDAPTLRTRLAELQAQRTALDAPTERETYEAARTAVLALVELMRTEPIGVTARVNRLVDDLADAGDGEVVISVSGYPT